MKTGRNDPCPCGSGKKHKHCCLGRGEPSTARDESSETGSARSALDWLRRHHPEAWAEAFSRFLVGLDGQEVDRLMRSEPGLQRMVEVNATEWTLAEGEIEIEGRPLPVAELLLGPGGPILLAQDRRWLEGLAGNPLRLYEIQEAVPGEGVRLRAVFPSGEESRFVRERAASRTLVRWDLIGARLLPVEDGLVMSGAIYPLERRQLPAIEKSLHRPGAARREGKLVVQAWLRRIAAPPPPLPTMVDTGTGDPLLFVTDHYTVLDWRVLTRALEKERDVAGSREESWAWLEGEPDNVERRVRLALNPGRGDRLEAFARTLSRAEEGKAWLERVAGGTIVFRSREIVDPLSALERQEPARTPRGPQVRQTTEMMQEIYGHFYRNWADEPIEALGRRSPRQAIRTAQGRRKVVDLLKLYEQNEARQALDDERQPASLQFLWEQVNLPSED